MDRLSIRARPEGNPIMQQTWDKLLFMHWSFPESVLRAHVPEPLQIDTFDGRAWVGVTPFTIRNARPEGLPAVPFVSDSHELNVRTYVHYDGVPGVWFFSLDASNPLAVLGARVGFGLPYYQARMALEEDGETIRFSSRRTHPGATAAVLEATWQRGTPLPEAPPGSLDFFLIERYCLYAKRGDQLLRARIHHRPWPLCEARLEASTSTMLDAHGLPTPEDAPLLHGQAAPLDVVVWPLEAV